MNSAGIPSIHEVVAHHYEDPATPPPEALVSALINREEALADTMRMAGVQFGLYPQIVAEVLAELQFGAPITDAQRTLIKAQFVQLMNELAAQAGEQGEGGTPV